MTTRRHTTLWTFAITSVALFMVSLDNLVVTTALPVIRSDLGASLEQLEWTVNAYTLTFAVLLLTGAALGDRFGRRRMFAIGLGVFTLGSVGAALAPSVEALNAARAVQGLGGAIVMPLTLTLLSAAVPPEKRGLALGAWGGVGGLATAGRACVGLDRRGAGARVQPRACGLGRREVRGVRVAGDEPGSGGHERQVRRLRQGPDPRAHPASVAGHRGRGVERHGGRPGAVEGRPLGRVHLEREQPGRGGHERQI